MTEPVNELEACHEIIRTQQVKLEEQGITIAKLHKQNCDLKDELAVFKKQYPEFVYWRVGDEVVG